MAKRFDVIACVLRKYLGAPPTIGAEIGVYNGNTSRMLLEMFPQLKMICVDQWIGYDDYKDYDTDHLAQKFEVFEREVLRVFPGRIRLLKMESLAAAGQVRNGTLDFAFIDARHDYPFIRRDILAWEPKLRPGGFMFGHDYGGGRAGVAGAVDEIYGDRVHCDDDTMWWVRIRDPAIVREFCELEAKQ